MGDSEREWCEVLSVVLKKAIGLASLSFGELHTLLVEIETTLNNRPLTFVYDDEKSISYALTPSHGLRPTDCKRT